MSTRPCSHSELRSAAKLISNLQFAGGIVRLVDSTLQIFPPRGGVSPGLLAALKRHQVAMAMLLGMHPYRAPHVALKVIGRRPAAQPERDTPQPEMSVHNAPDEAAIPTPDLRKLQGYWVRTGGGGRRYVLPRLKPPMFALLNKLEPTWHTFDCTISDPRSRRALERRGLAQFREQANGLVLGRLTNPGFEVREAHRRKTIRKRQRELRERKKKEKAGKEEPNGSTLH